jgi:hypothetical protein
VRKADTFALDQFRSGVEAAVKTLGRGYLACPANADLRRSLNDGTLSPTEYSRELFRVVYRLLALFIAEDRERLLTPDAPASAKDRYRREYSTQRLRRIAEQDRDTSHTDLSESLSLVIEKLGGTGDPALALPAFGGLFDPARTPVLTTCRLANSDLLDAVRHLSVITDGSTRHAVEFRNLGAEVLGHVYESLLELRPSFDRESGQFELTVAGGNERKTTGSYYTPASLITCLLDSTLDPVLDEAAKANDPEAAILDLRLCDPACGFGHFLIAAAKRMAKRLATVRTNEAEPAADAIQYALRDVVSHCIYGVDINPVAVELCQVSLWLEACEPGRSLSFLDDHTQCGNSLLGATPELLAAGIPDVAFEPSEGDEKPRCSRLRKRNRQHRREREAGSHTQTNRMDQLLADLWCAAFVWPKRDDVTVTLTDAEFCRVQANPEDIEPGERDAVKRMAEQYGFFHWHLRFASVMARSGFDVVLGNPPFVNAIEGNSRDSLKNIYRFLHPDLGGTADVSYLFLDRSTRWIHEHGTIGFILPRAVLNAAPAEAMRQRLTVGNLRPIALMVPDSARYFHGAAVFVCMVALGHGPGRTCRVCIQPELESTDWKSGAVARSNWWAEVKRIARGRKLEDTASGAMLGSLFTVAASMTAGDAYEIRSHVRDDEHAPGLRLVTTGLIEPRDCLWGRVPCRYLKSDYRFPRVPVAEEFADTLKRRLKRSARPKIIVAGLSSRIECFIDRSGEYVGAVSTFSIFHAKDDVELLHSLCEFLLTDAVTERFRDELGGNAMGGGNITMRKDFLERLRLPEQLPSRFSRADERSSFVAGTVQQFHENRPAHD